MALITRVSRLFRADVHAVLDRIEEPDVLLRQAVREMEESLAHDERRLKLMEHEHTQLNNRITDLGQTIEEVEGELNICFAAAKDDLARTLVKRKLETQQVRKLVTRKRDNLQQTLETLREQLDENRGRLDSMRQKAELFDEQRLAPQLEPNCESLASSVSDADVEVALLREKQKRMPS